MRYTEHTRPSIIHGCMMTRLSIDDGHGGELWMWVAHGKGYRQRRDDALDCLAEALQEGLPPGEVRVR